MTGQPRARWYRSEGTDLLIDVRVQARAARAAIGAVVNDRLQVRLTSPPIDGRANAELCALICEAFSLARSRIVLARGAKRREKQLRVLGCTQLPPSLAGR